MEIILENLTTNSLKEEKKLNKLNYIFKDNIITFCYGISGELLKDLIINKKNRISGNVRLEPKGSIKDIGYLGNNTVKHNAKNNILEEFENLNKDLILGYELVNERAIKSLKMVGLDEKYLKRNFSKLSLSEQKKIELALVLFYNPKILILDFFEKGFNYKDIDYIKKILKIIKVKYKKNIIIFSDNIEIFMDILDQYVIFDKGKVVLNGDNQDIYNQDIYKYIECPRIIKFVKKVRDNNIELLNYIDVKELIKAIYRDVENK